VTPVPPAVALGRLVRQVERALRGCGRSMPTAAREDLARACAEARRAAGMPEEGA
jgi:hypothetical protein